MSNSIYNLNSSDTAEAIRQIKTLAVGGEKSVSIIRWNSDGSIRVIDNAGYREPSGDSVFWNDADWIFNNRIRYAVTLSDIGEIELKRWNSIGWVEVDLNNLRSY